IDHTRCRRIAAGDSGHRRGSPPFSAGGPSRTAAQPLALQLRAGGLAGPQCFTDGRLRGSHRNHRPRSDRRIRLRRRTLQILPRQTRPPPPNPPPQKRSPPPKPPPPQPPPLPKRSSPVLRACDSLSPHDEALEEFDQPLDECCCQPSPVFL